MATDISGISGSMPSSLLSFTELLLFSGIFEMSVEVALLLPPSPNEDSSALLPVMVFFSRSLSFSISSMDF